MSLLREVQLAGDARTATTSISTLMPSASVSRCRMLTTSGIRAMRDCRVSRW